MYSNCLPSCKLLIAQKSRDFLRINHEGRKVAFLFLLFPCQHYIFAKQKEIPQKVISSIKWIVSSAFVFTVHEDKQKSVT